MDTVKCLIEKMIRIDEENKKNNKVDYDLIKDKENTNYSRIERFMSRHILVIRHATHIGRKYYSNVYSILSQFINKIQNYYLHNGFDPGLVVNMDETPIFFF